MRAGDGWQPDRRHNRTASAGRTKSSTGEYSQAGQRRDQGRIFYLRGRLFGGEKIALIFNVKNFYAKFWTLLKMYTWNVPPMHPLIRFINMPVDTMEWTEVLRRESVPDFIRQDGVRNNWFTRRSWNSHHHQAHDTEVDRTSSRAVKTTLNVDCSALGVWSK